MSVRFEGFPPEAVEFLDGLELNNHREWFQANKAVYERACREPMKALVAELEPEFGESKIFRINRDVRFSPDKSPYKTWVAAVIGRNYVSLSTEGFYVGGGMYKPSSDGLKRFRAAIHAEGFGRDLERIVGTLERKGYEVETHDRLKTAPKGYSQDHPRIELLRMKDIVAGRGFPPEPWLSTREALKRVKRIFQDLGPLNTWLERHVG